MRHRETDSWEQVQEQSKAVLPDRVVKLIEKCLQDEHPDGHLINVLHEVQGHFGYLGKPQLDAVAQLLQVPATRVTGVATFYHFFKLQPPGKFIINVCMGTACYVKGSAQVAARVRQELGIDFGQTTRDGLFSLVNARCLGTCGLAPIVMINEDSYPKVRPDQVPGMLDKYRRLAQEQAAQT